MTLWQLDQDPETKSTFNSLKKELTEIVSWNALLSKFTINQDKFHQIIEKEKSSSTVTEQTSLLITRGDTNLLKDSIIAHVFGMHQINASPLRAEVHMKEEIKANSLFKFLKMNLLNTHKINYGIDYEINDDILNFSGVANSYLEGKTLVIQIVTRRNRILKEIRVHGKNSENMRNSQRSPDHVSNENHYEVF